MHRASLTSLSAADRTELARLIGQYTTPAVVGTHFNAPPQVHFDGSVFLSWHRNYLLGLENFLEDEGHPECRPLPAWDPSERIPDEFNIPDSGPDALRDLTPNVSFEDFEHRRLDRYDSDEELGMELMGPHDAVHVTVGGVKATFRSPRAPIFWPWHSFIDDIWAEWQRQTVITPDCTGLRRAQARRLLDTVGSRSGTPGSRLTAILARPLAGIDTWSSTSGRSPVSVPITAARSIWFSAGHRHLI